MNAHPAEEFADFLAALSVLKYARIAELCILEAAAAGPGSDWHWKTAACWDEARRRQCPGLYDRAVRRASGDPSVTGLLS